MVSVNQRSTTSRIRGAPRWQIDHHDGLNGASPASATCNMGKDAKPGNGDFCSSTDGLYSNNLQGGAPVG